MAFLRFRSVYCIPEDDMVHDKRIAFSSVCITTATLSAYGAFVQLRSWYRHLKDFDSRRKPSSNPVIVFCLALADLFTCIGVIGMAILFMTMHPPYQIDIYVPQYGKYVNMTHPYQHWYKYIGVPVESFTMFAYISSYMWTLAYALDICLQVYNKDKSVNMWSYQICFWVIPLWLVFWGQFGYLEGSNSYCSISEQEILHYMVCFVPLVCVFLSLPVIYILAFMKIQKNIKSAHGYFTNAERELLSAVKKKFSLIFLVFFCCWITNFWDGFFDIKYLHQKGPYIDERRIAHFEAHFAIWMIEAVVNPLQGFLNCLAYGQGSDMTRCFHYCCQSPTTHSSFIWPETRSDPSESFLINSQETLERSPLLRQSDNQSRQTAYSDGKTSPFFEAKKTFIPRLLGEPKIT